MRPTTTQLVCFILGVQRASSLSHVDLGVEDPHHHHHHEHEHEHHHIDIDIQDSKHHHHHIEIDIEEEEEVYPVPVAVPGVPTRPSQFHNITCLPAYKNEHYNEPENLCVFTSPSFWHGRGMSVFTNDASHEYLHSLDVLRFPHAHTLHPTLPPHERLYDVKSVPGKGMSGVANTYIEPGTTILAQHPALIIHSPDDGRDGDPVRSEYYETMVNKLPPHNRDAFLELSSHFDDGTSHVDGVIHTNSFAIDLGVESHKAVFPDISRFNHDCRPNSEYTWSEQTLSMHVRAVRLIEPGEEITISYISQDLPTHERIKSLHDMWGFKCSCKFCTLPTHLQVASDHRTNSMASILDTLERPLSHGPPMTTHKVESMINEYLTLAQMERLHSRIPSIYIAGAKLFAASLHNKHHHHHGNNTLYELDRYMTHLRMALNYTSLALQSGMQIHGGDWDELEDMTDLADLLLEKLP